jgi:hypothetical protein
MYKFTVTIKNEDDVPSTISIDQNIETAYQAKNEVRNIGVNGLIDNQRYYPPHRILEINFEEL